MSTTLGSPTHVHLLVEEPPIVPKEYLEIYEQEQCEGEPKTQTRTTTKVNIPNGGEKHIDVDEFLLLIGQFGKSQKLLMLILYLMMFPHSYHTLSWHFTGHSPPWKCSTTGIGGFNAECNISGTIDVGDPFYESRCTMQRRSWDFVVPKEYSIVTEWDLVCEKKEYPFLANSSMWFGWAVGAFIFGFLSDRFGRKRVLYTSWTAMVVGPLTCSIVHNFWLYTGIAFAIGCAQGGVALTIYVMASELVGPQYKSITSGAGTGLTYTLCLCLLSLQAWLIQNWRLFLVVTSAPYLILLLFYKVLPESIRWLRINNRVEEAEKILRTMCKFNGKPWPVNVKLSPPVFTGKKGNVTDLFKSKKLALDCLVQCFVWFVIGQVYFGISLASDQLGGNIYRDFILTSLVGIPGNILVMVLTNRFGRKPTLISGMGLGSFACIGVSLIHPKSTYIWVRIGFGMLGQLCLALSFSSMYAWSLELMPTVIRSQGMGILSVVTRLGGCTAPWVAQWLEHIHYVLPFAVMGGFAFISSILCSRLPETLGVPTSETLTDAISHTSSNNKITSTGTATIFFNKRNKNNIQQI